MGREDRFSLTGRGVPRRRRASGCVCVQRCQGGGQRRGSERRICSNWIGLTVAGIERRNDGQRQREFVDQYDCRIGQVCHFLSTRSNVLKYLKATSNSNPVSKHAPCTIRRRFANYEKTTRSCQHTKSYHSNWHLGAKSETSETNVSNRLSYSSSKLAARLIKAHSV